MDAVRVEEMINYFDYAWPTSDSRDEPFKPTITVSDSPWAEGKKLLHIGIKGYEIDAAGKPRSNLVFLLDVSGSMNSPDKLPLVKQSMALLLTSLNPDDTVAIAVYAGAAGTVLEPTPVKDKRKILAALDRLEAGGSTAGAEGIRLAYQLAEAHFDKRAINRVILATDGDFNVGITNPEELQDFVERRRDQGIFLSVLGFGQGNYHDRMMQTLAQNGNGVAAYIDTLSEAQKVLVDEATSTLFPIAKDVKIQVEFNPNTVAEYRLIGYETRRLNREDFNNDAVDAGDIGAGHTVTALYEITPVGSKARLIDENRYADKAETSADSKLNEEYAFLKIRYKLPAENESRLITQPIGRQHDLSTAGGKPAGWIRRETGFAAAVAGFGQLLKGGRYTGAFDYDDVIELAQQNKGDDRYGYRAEFIQLVRKAKSASAMK
jgi:Ca-activated chloride channel family protein